MPRLAESVLRYIRQRQLLKPGDRVGVAVSGGADSVALLGLLLDLREELGVVLSVVHFNHRLRGNESEGDEQFVSNLAQSYQLPFHGSGADTSCYAQQNHLSLEAAGQRLRYAYFRELMEEGAFTQVATAHTLDDQAETVLLRLVRGAGTRGLAGIYPRLPIAGSQFSVIRPLLATYRQDVRDYLAELGQDWREDRSNRDLRFARNRVRHGVLPRLERNLNPEVCRVLSETAEIARAEEDYWKRETERVLPQSEKGVEISVLQGLPLALQRRVVRAAAETVGLRLEFRHVAEALEIAGALPGSPQSASLPGGWTLLRRGSLLSFRRAAAQEKSAYEYRLTIPGRIEVPELAVVFEAAPVFLGGGAPGYNPEHLFDPQLLAKELVVRNWRPGDRFWPAHTREPKKIKELLQQHHIQGQERKTWPVVASGDSVIWVRGFRAPARLRPAQGSREAVVIREEPWAQIGGRRATS